MTAVYTIALSQREGVLTGLAVLFLFLAFCSAYLCANLTSGHPALLLATIKQFVDRRVKSRNAASRAIRWEAASVYLLQIGFYIFNAAVTSVVIILMIKQETPVISSLNYGAQALCIWSLIVLAFITQSTSWTPLYSTHHILASFIVTEIIVFLLVQLLGVNEHLSYRATGALWVSVSLVPMYFLWERKMLDDSLDESNAMQFHRINFLEIDGVPHKGFLELLSGCCDARKVDEDIAYKEPATTDMTVTDSISPSSNISTQGSDSGRVNKRSLSKQIRKTCRHYLNYMFDITEAQWEAFLWLVSLLPIAVYAIILMQKSDEDASYESKGGAMIVLAVSFLNEICVIPLRLPTPALFGMIIIQRFVVVLSGSSYWLFGTAFVLLLTSSLHAMQITTYHFPNSDGKASAMIKAMQDMASQSKAIRKTIRKSIHDAKKAEYAASAIEASTGEVNVNVEKILQAADFEFENKSKAEEGADEDTSGDGKSTDPRAAENASHSEGLDRQDSDLSQSEEYDEQVISLKLQFFSLFALQVLLACFVVLGELKPWSLHLDTFYLSSQMAWVGLLWSIWICVFLSTLLRHAVRSGGFGNLKNILQQLVEGLELDLRDQEAADSSQEQPGDQSPTSESGQSKPTWQRIEEASLAAASAKSNPDSPRITSYSKTAKTNTFVHKICTVLMCNRFQKGSTERKFVVFVVSSIAELLRPNMEGRFYVGILAISVWLSLCGSMCFAAYLCQVWVIVPPTVSLPYILFNFINFREKWETDGCPIPDLSFRSKAKESLTASEANIESGEQTHVAPDAAVMDAQKSTAGGFPTYYWSNKKGSEAATDPASGTLLRLDDKANTEKTTAEPQQGLYAKFQVCATSIIAAVSWLLTINTLRFCFVLFLVGFLTCLPFKYASIALDVALWILTIAIMSLCMTYWRANLEMDRTLLTLIMISWIPTLIWAIENGVNDSTSGGAALSVILLLGATSIQLIMLTFIIWKDSLQMFKDINDMRFPKETLCGSLTAAFAMMICVLVFFAVYYSGPVGIAMGIALFVFMLFCYAKLGFINFKMRLSDSTRMRSRSMLSFFPPLFLVCCSIIGALTTKRKVFWWLSMGWISIAFLVLGTGLWKEYRSTERKAYNKNFYPVFKANIQTGEMIPASLEASPALIFSCMMAAWALWASMLVQTFNLGIIVLVLCFVWSVLYSKFVCEDLLLSPGISAEIDSHILARALDDSLTALYRDAVVVTSGHGSKLDIKANDTSSVEKDERARNIANMQTVEALVLERDIAAQEVTECAKRVCHTGLSVCPILNWVQAYRLDQLSEAKWDELTNDCVVLEEAHASCLTLTDKLNKLVAMTKLKALAMGAEAMQIRANDLIDFLRNTQPSMQSITVEELSYLPYSIVADLRVGFRAYYLSAQKNKQQQAIKAAAEERIAKAKEIARKRQQALQRLELEEKMRRKEEAEKEAKLREDAAAREAQLKAEAAAAEAERIAAQVREAAAEAERIAAQVREEARIADEIAKKAHQDELAKAAAEAAKKAQQDAEAAARKRQQAEKMRRKLEAEKEAKLQEDAAAREAQLKAEAAAAEAERIAAQVREAAAAEAERIAAQVREEARIAKEIARKAHQDELAKAAAEAAKKAQQDAEAAAEAAKKAQQDAEAAARKRQQTIQRCEAGNVKGNVVTTFGAAVSGTVESVIASLKKSSAVSGGKFTDPDWNSLKVVLGDGEDKLCDKSAGYGNGLKLARISDIEPDLHKNLELNTCTDKANPPGPADVMQGGLGDCYLLSAVSTIAERVAMIDSIIVHADPKLGLYVVRLFFNGAFRCIVLDDFFPVNIPSWSGGKLTLAFQKYVGPQNLWVCLIEKAYAKLHGTYQAIVGGFEDIAMADLTGGIPGRINDLSKDASIIWKKILTMHEDGHLLGAGSAAGKDTEHTDSGIVKGHAYSILACKEIDGNRLMQLRNPWAKFEWKGRWSDGSSDWTPRLKKMVNYVDKDDGCFWMAFEDFSKNFRNIYTCRLTSSMNLTEVQGRWSVSEHTAGGAQPRDSYKNPQYTLVCEKSCKVTVLLSQAETTKEQSSTNSTAKAMGLEAYTYTGINANNSNAKHERRESFFSQSKLIANSRYEYTRDITIDFDIQPSNTVVLLPQLFEKGHESDFQIRVFTSEGKCKLKLLVPTVIMS